MPSIRWEKMAKRGAHVLRPKWSRTTPRNPAYPETYYIDALIGENSVTTFSPITLNAFIKYGQVKPTIETQLEEAFVHMNQIEMLGNLHSANKDKSAEMLKSLQQKSINNENIFDALMETVKYCSLGQITNALFEVGGQYRRNM